MVRLNVSLYDKFSVKCPSCTIEFSFARFTRARDTPHYAPDPTSWNDCDSSIYISWFLLTLSHVYATSRSE